MSQSKFKVILLDDTGIGKTFIARRQSQDSFDFKMMPTIGASHLQASVDFEVQSVDLLGMDWGGNRRALPGGRAPRPHRKGGAEAGQHRNRGPMGARGALLLRGQAV